MPSKARVLEQAIESNILFLKFLADQHDLIKVKKGDVSRCPACFSDWKS